MGITRKRFALVFIAALAVALPVGFSVASSQSPSQNERAMDAAHADLREIGVKPDPSLTFDERRERSNAEMNEIAERAAEAAGGRLEPPFPPGVVFRAHPNPLDEVDPEQYASFCARIAKSHPEDRSCELNKLVQAGEIPPGDYTQEEIDAVFQEEK